MKSTDTAFLIMASFALLTGCAQTAGRYKAASIHRGGDQGELASSSEFPARSGFVSQNVRALQTDVQLHHQGVESPGLRAALIRPVSLQSEATVTPAEELPLVSGANEAPRGNSDAFFDLESMYHIALMNNPAIPEAEARLRATRGKWVQVGLWPNPTIGYSGQQLGSGGQAEQNGFLLGQEFVRGHKLALNRSIAAQEIRAAEQRLRAVRLKLRADVRAHFYETLAAQKKISLTEELVRIGKKTSQMSDVLRATGDINLSTQLQARVQGDLANVALANRRAERIAAWRRLSAVLGQPGMQTVWVAGRLDRNLPNLSWEQTRAEVLQGSPDVAAAWIEVERAQRALRRAVAEPTPNVDIEAVVQSDQGTNSTNANLVLKMPLPVFDRNQGGIQQAKAVLVAARLAVGRSELEQMGKLSHAFQRYQIARNQADRYSQTGGILENTQKALTVATALYEAQETSYLDLLVAQRSYFEANLTYIESLRQAWTAIAEIEGYLLRDS